MKKISKFEKFKIYLMMDPRKKSRYLKEHNIFYSVGDNLFFQPRKIPADPKLIKFHNNDVIASDVTFITHDITNYMLKNYDQRYYKYQTGCIEVMDNVFIGSKVIILPNVRIGNNVIVGAGSIVTKDIPDNSVVAGNPAKVISSFEDYVIKRKIKEEDMIELTDTVEEEIIWKDFYSKRGE